MTLPTHRWTCGQCGEVFEVTSQFPDSTIGRLRRDHKDEHRLEALTPDERQAELEMRVRAWAAKTELTS